MRTLIKVFAFLWMTLCLSACTAKTDIIDEAKTEIEKVKSLHHAGRGHATEIGTVNPNIKLLRETSPKGIFFKADKICQTSFLIKNGDRPFWSTDELKKAEASLTDEYNTGKYNTVLCYEGPKGGEKDITKYALMHFGDLCGRGLYEEYLGRKFDDIPKDILNLLRPTGYKLRVFDVRYGQTYGTLDKNLTV